MLTLTQALLSVVLLLSVVFGLPLAEENTFEGLEIDLPSEEFHFPLTTDSRIFGGQEALVGQFPHQVSVRLNPFGSGFRHICGGSIITNRFVITAGHCFIARFPELNLYRVVAGAHLNNGNDGYAFDLKQWIVHENFDINITETNAIVKNDIALIQTVTTIVFNNFVAPIELHREFLQGGVETITSGWGKTNDNVTNLKWLNMTTLTNDECRKRFAGVTNQPPPVHDWDTICVFSGKENFGVCSGDSGGPLVSDKKLIGLTSWAFGCGRGVPDGFTRVSTYVNWVNSKILTLFLE